MFRIARYLLLPLAPLAMLPWLASDAGAGSEPHIGRCRMDYCSWSSILKKDLVKQVKDAALYRVEVRGGTSGEYAPSEDYPDKYDPSVRIKWDDPAGTALIFCYSRLPAVIFGNQVTVLNFSEVGGSRESAANLYVNVCHDGDSFDWLSEKWRKEYGYGPPLTEDVTIDTPADLFGYVRR